MKAWGTDITNSSFSATSLFLNQKGAKTNIAIASRKQKASIMESSYGNLVIKILPAS